MKFEKTKKRLDSLNLSVDKHSQIIHFSGGRKATILNIVQVWVDSFIHLVTEDGREYIINQNNVDFTEVSYDK